MQYVIYVIAIDKLWISFYKSVLNFSYLLVLWYFQVFVENLFVLASFLLFFRTCDTCPPEIQSSVTFLAGKYEKDLNIRKQSKQIKQYITQKSGNAGGRLLRLLLRPRLIFLPHFFAKCIFYIYPLAREKSSGSKIYFIPLK